MGRSQFLTKQAELCYIGDPLLIWSFRMEVPIQQIWRDFSHFSFVRVILFDSNTANQSQFLHETLHRLVVQMYSFVAQCFGNTPVSIPAFVFVIDRSDLFFCPCIFICPLCPLQMVVEGGTRQLSDFKQEG